MPGKRAMHVGKPPVPFLATLLGWGVLSTGCSLPSSTSPVRAELGADLVGDPSGLLTELQAMREDERPELAELLRGAAPRGTWGPRPWDRPLVGPTPAIDLARRALIDRELERSGGTALERVRAELERDRLERALAPARPLLGPDRGLPRRAVLHLLFGHSLHDAAGCRAWVARLSSLVAALETAPIPALAFSAPSPTTGRAWSALASEDLAELLLGRLDAGTRLVPDLDRVERRELLREAERLLEGPLGTGIESAALRGFDPEAGAIRGLSLQLGGLTLHRDRAGALVTRGLELRGLAEQLEARLSALPPRASAKEGNSDPAALQPELDAALGEDAPALEEWLLLVPLPTPLEDLLTEPLVAGRTRGTRPRLRVVTRSGTARSFRQDQALLEALLVAARRERATDEPSWLRAARWPGWEQAVAVLARQVSERSEGERVQLAADAERELLARARMDLGLHRERWSRERAVRYLEEQLATSREEAAWWVDLALDEPARLLGPVAQLDALRALGSRMGWRPGRPERGRAFLGAVLEAGPAPVELLEAALVEQP